MTELSPPIGVASQRLDGSCGTSRFSQVTRFPCGEIHFRSVVKRHSARELADVTVNRKTPPSTHVESVKISEFLAAEALLLRV